MERTPVFFTFFPLSGGPPAARTEGSVAVAVQWKTRLNIDERDKENDDQSLIASVFA